MTLSQSSPLSPSRISQQQASACNIATTQKQQINTEQLLLTQDNLASPPPEEALTLKSMISHSVNVISKISKRQKVSAEVHLKIVRTIQHSLATAAVKQPNSIETTSGATSASTWINILDAGEARSKKTTILNMMEWIGAAEWFDTEVQQAQQALPRTKRGAPRKRVATIILDKYFQEVPDSEDHSLPITSNGIQNRILDEKRQRFIKNVNKGRNLRQLVQMTHLGILFQSNVPYVFYCILYGIY